MKKLISLLLAGAMALSLFACTKAPEEDKEKTPDPARNVPISELTAGVTASYKPHTVKADTKPLSDLGKAMLEAAEGENPVVSPLSAWFALALAANGAAGDTAKEFAALLGGDADSMNDTALAIADALGRCTGENTVFSAANSAWVDGNAAILDEYLDKLVAVYNAQAFSGTLSSREAMEQMNSWVSGKTRGLIPTLFEDPLDKDTMLVLINTLYMKAKWQSTFKKESTYDDTFKAATGELTVPFMHRTASMEYLSGQGYEGVVLPYRSDGDNCLEFVAVKPTGGTVRQLLASMDAAELASLRGEGRRVALSMPKFTAEEKLELKDVLTDLGLKKAFTPFVADFSKMGTSKDGDPLYIGRVLQKVKIIVDEEGTEAAAATAVVVPNATAMPPTEMIFLRLDEPFIYLVRDAQTGAVSFMGIVDAPKAP